MSTTITQAAGPCTPAQHASTSNTKPVRLLELGDGPHGKTVLCEFPGAWQRTIALPVEADAWHPLFSDLPKDDARRLRKHAVPPITVHPDGTRTRQGALSFITDRVSRNGGWAGGNCFDVPAENNHEGYLTGYRCAGELLHALQHGHGPHLPVRNIIEAAMQATNEDMGEASRRGAGFGFMAIFEDALKFMAQHANHGPYMAEKIADAERMHASLAEQDTREKAAFVQRMRAAKAEKRSSKAQHKSSTVQHLNPNTCALEAQRTEKACHE